MKEPLACDAFVRTMPTWAAGTWGVIVNTDCEKFPGTHWVLVIVELKGKARPFRERRSLDPRSLQGIVRIVDPLDGSLAIPLADLTRARTGLQVGPIESMRWQRDDWRCGYFSLYALITAPRPLVITTPVIPMPTSFTAEVARILGNSRKYVKSLLLLFVVV